MERARAKASNAQLQHDRAGNGGLFPCGQTISCSPSPEPPQESCPCLSSWHRAAPKPAPCASASRAGGEARGGSADAPPRPSTHLRPQPSAAAESSPLADRRWEMGLSWARLEALDFKGICCSGACYHFSTSDLLPFTEPFLSCSLHVGGRGPQQHAPPESVLTGAWRFPCVPVATPGYCNGPVQSRMSSFSSSLPLLEDTGHDQKVWN